jgi:peroxiredoxin
MENARFARTPFRERAICRERFEFSGATEMKMRSAMIPVVLMFAVPAWADCGACGAGTHAARTAQTPEKNQGPAEVGKPAPDFALKDLDGKEWRLSDLRGKVVVLEWVNHECPVVNRYHQTKTMSKTWGTFENKPVVWLAIDSSHLANDKADNIRKWAKAHEVDYSILLDAPGKVGRAYGAKTTPHTFVIDQEGTLVYAGSPDNDRYGNKENRRNYLGEAVSATLQGVAVRTPKTKPFGCSVKYKG